MDPQGKGAIKYPASVCPFLEFFPGTIHWSFLIFLHVISLPPHWKLDGVELFRKKYFWVFDLKGSLDPKLHFFVQIFSLELLIEILDLKISDFR